MRRSVGLIFIASIISLALLPVSALAASPTCQAYNPQTCAVQGVSTSTGTSGSNNSPSNSTTSGSGSASGSGTSTGGAVQLRGGTSLPFTGLDAALLATGGLVLLGIGAAVRLTVSRRHV